MPTEHDATIANAAPCPFCGSNDLTINQWHLDEKGEVDAIECNECLAGALCTVWNCRATNKKTEKVNTSAFIKKLATI